MKISRISASAVSFIAVAFGLLYLFIHDITPWHQQFIGVPFGTLLPQVQLLLKAFIKLIGIFFISFGVGFYLYWNDVRGQMKNKRWHLLAFILPILCVLQFFTFFVGGSAPVWAPAICIIGAVLSTIED